MEELKVLPMVKDNEDYCNEFILEHNGKSMEVKMSFVKLIDSMLDANFKLVSQGANCLMIFQKD